MQIRPTCVTAYKPVPKNNFAIRIQRERERERERAVVFASSALSREPLLAELELIKNLPFLLRLDLELEQRGFWNWCGLAIFTNPHFHSLVQNAYKIATSKLCFPDHCVTSSHFSLALNTNPSSPNSISLSLTYESHKYYQRSNHVVFSRINKFPLCSISIH